MRSKNDDRIRFQDAWIYIKWGFGIIGRLSPSYLPLSALNSLISAAQPLLVLYFTAQILNELSGRRNVRTIIFYVMFTTLITFLLSLGRALISKSLAVIDSIIQHRMYFFHGERYMDFDFEHVENSKTNEMLADIEAKINGNGLGIARLYLTFPVLVQRFTGIVVSSILLTGMFAASGTYEKNFFTSPFATAALCILIILAMIFTFMLRKKEEGVLKKVFESNPKTNTFIHYYREYVEAGRAGKDIRIFHQQPAIKEIIDYWMSTAPWHEYFHFEGKLGGATAAANALIGGCVYLLIGLRSLAGMYGIGSVVQYVGAVTSLVENLTNFINECGTLVTNSQYLAQFFQYLDLPDEMYRGSLTTEKRSDNEYEIEFHNVSFKYPGTDTYAIKNLSLKLHVGQRLAVVGMNGSGKTTMIKLLCRLYDPTEGEITLNGINIKKYDYAEYMNIFSVVFQDFKLFDYTLGQNVAASVDVDREMAEACLQKAGFSVRLDKMPKGLDTFLYKGFDENGVEISGGEAQKIAMARALYKDAPIIVLDEPTAALDPIAEFEVYSKFNEIIGNKTAIYISHRLSSCRFCDDIAVFHKGELVQRGSHEELIKDTKGKYFELWEAQAQYYV